MKIAVIGSGISGLLSARLLAAEHEVHVFEANGYAGGHTNTVEFEAFGRRYAADTGFMVFNDRTYPNFVEMLRTLGVPARWSDMSFSVRCDRTGLEYQGSSLNGLFAQRRNLLRPSFYRMLLDVLRFNRRSLELLRGVDNEFPFGKYLDCSRLPGIAFAFAFLLFGIHPALDTIHFKSATRRLAFTLTPVPNWIPSRCEQRPASCSGDRAITTHRLIADNCAGSISSRRLADLVGNPDRLSYSRSLPLNTAYRLGDLCRTVMLSGDNQACGSPISRLTPARRSARQLRGPPILPAACNGW